MFLKTLMRRPSPSAIEPTSPQTMESAVRPSRNYSNTDKVAEAFDAIAERFDQSFESSPVIQRLRKRVYNVIGSLVPQGSSILDMNCGIGIDAAFLGKQGYNVVGIDISTKMIEQAKRKLESDRHNVEFYVSSFEHIVQLPSHRYDLILSNFGGLNCTNNLHTVAEQIGLATRQGGFFVGVVMPRFCIWETVSGLTHGRWDYAFRRLRKGIPATGFSEKSFSVYYHSPRRVISAFRPWFVVERVCGLSIFSPPPSASSFIKKHPRLTTLLERLDALVERFPLERSMGDHFMIVLRKKAK